MSMRTRRKIAEDKKKCHHDHSRIHLIAYDIHKTHDFQINYSHIPQRITTSLNITKTKRILPRNELR